MPPLLRTRSRGQQSIRAIGIKSRKKQEIKPGQNFEKDGIKSCEKDCEKANQAVSCPRNTSCSPEEILGNLSVSLNKLFEQKESLYFRHPVDTVKYHDYLKIIKMPMDLLTIKRKLDEYENLWQYVNDVWTIFYNAWLYNHKGSVVYEHAIKLAEAFLTHFEPVMKQLGYCCSQKHQFYPADLYCYGKNQCSIPPNADYYAYQDRFALCVGCFEDFKGDLVPVNEKEKPLEHVNKKALIKVKNDVYEEEKFVKCVDCEREFHQICVLYIEDIWPIGYVCDSCLLTKKVSRDVNNFTAKNLSMSAVANYIEQRIKKFLKSNGITDDVIIRELSSIRKIIKFEPMLGLIDPDDLKKEFPYRAKTIFAFQEIDGVDVCIFGMHVQEYDSVCPPPNTRCVYIAYVDSVQFFQPRRFRTEFYQEIILGYLHYVKGLGFSMAHIWACPPNEGDDYIFYRHPPEQKTPSSKRLHDWYVVMLDKGVKEGIVYSYHNIHQQAIINDMKKPADMPIFEGDFQQMFFDGFAEEWKKYEKGKMIEDCDNLIECDFVDDREVFISAAAQNRREFSSLRRAKYSTMALLLDLHNKTL